MKFKRTELPEVIEFFPSCFDDERGFFFESFNEKAFNKVVGHKVNFVQDNHSFSKKDILRGIHYQLNPFSQGKLVRVVEGAVIDVAIDLRSNSRDFGKWVSREISSSLNNQLWIPQGFGHAFRVISDSVHFLYKTTTFYSKEHERVIIWNDKDLNIDWGDGDIVLSPKDLDGKSLIDADVFD